MQTRIRNRRNKGQNLIEYTVVLGIVTVALIGMQTYFKRGIQSVVRVVADNYSNNSNNTQREPIGEVEKRIKQAKGPLTSTSISSSSMTQKQKNVGGSDIQTETSGTTTATGNSKTIVGDFREKDLR
ncbi:MAG: hypothetical protein NTW64_01970 [Candidatus Omnitrophica bacterium]|nr:hypothetical protein [Candidatus Omnitrophota bacterium]